MLKGIEANIRTDGSLDMTTEQWLAWFYFSRALPADQLTAFLLVSGVFLRL